LYHNPQAAKFVCDDFQGFRMRSDVEGELRTDDVSYFCALIEPGDNQTLFDADTSI